MAQIGAHLVKKVAEEVAEDAVQTKRIEKNPGKVRSALLRVLREQMSLRRAWRARRGHI